MKINLASKVNTIMKILRATPDLYLIYRSAFFDRKWYLVKNPDLSAWKSPLLIHYYFFGGGEGRDPGPNFSSNRYLQIYKDAKKTSVNPLVHYLKYGKAAGYQLKPPVLKLMRMYDYAKNGSHIIFEAKAEQTYMKRPNVSGLFSGTLQEGHANCPQPYVAFIIDAIVFGGSNVVISREDIVLSDELVDFNDSAFGIKLSLVTQRQKDSVEINFNKNQLRPDADINEGILLSCGHDMNYFHWLVECLPKLSLIDELNLFKDAPLLIPKGLHPNLMAALHKVNINNRPLILLEPDSPYRVKKLLAPSALSQVVDRYEGAPAFDVDIVLSQKWISKVSELLKKDLKLETKPWRKLYLTRKAGLRSLGNREEIERLVSEHGFEIVDLVGMSLESQIELFLQASLIVAPTGAALTNMLFCPPGTKVIILMSNHEVTNYYFWSNLGAIANLDVTIIAGERLFNLTDYWSVHDDYVVDTSILLDEVISLKKMNYSRYLYFKTLVVSIIERCSVLDQKMTPIAEFQRLRLFLESIEEVIRFEIQKILSKQGGGYWRVTNGDKVFINYMNNTLAAIDAALGKTSADSNEWYILINDLKQLLVRIEIEHNPKIKAVFLLQETFTWPSFESVYEAFAADPACEAHLIYVPFEHEHSDKDRDWFAEYKDRGLPIIHCQDYDISAESPDLVFFVKPYDSIPKQFYIDDIEKVVSRSIYIPYFVNWMALKNIDFLIDYHFRLPLHNRAWKIFDAPNYVRDFHVHYGSRNGGNVEMVGHPRFDSVHMMAKIKDDIPLSWKNKISQKTVFMWNTHAPMGGQDKKNDDWATFELFGGNMLSYFSLHKEVALLWRPHPMFFTNLINNGIMTAKEIEELRSNIEKSENIILDTLADYRYAFSVADALVSDASSLLVEFLGTNKPIMYSCPESTYYLVNEALLPAYYKATTWLEIENFLEMVTEGRDDIRVERMKVIKNNLVNLGKHIGEIVKDSCVYDSKKEEIASANKAVNEAKEN
jgi:hypothetical protein